VIGNRSNVQDNSVIHVYPDSRVIIEEDVTVAHGVILHDVHIKSRCVIGIAPLSFLTLFCEEDVFVSVGSIVPKACKFLPVKSSPATRQKLLTMSLMIRKYGKAGIDYYRDLCKKYLTTMKAVT